MRSENVLNEVMDNLHLREHWNEKMKPAPSLGPGDALRRLRAQIDIQPIPRTSLIQISVTSTDRNEPALIANEIARLHCEYRQEQREAASKEKIAALQSQWDEENDRFKEADEELRRVVAEIKEARAKSAGSLYDPASFEIMKTTREQLEAACIAQEGKIAGLKKLEPAKLRSALPLMVTNELLNATLERRAKAERERSEAEKQFGADAAETKRAAAVLQEIDNTATLVMAGVVSDQETELSAQKAHLQSLTDKLKTARTNVDELSTNNPAYVAALKNVQQLEIEREQLRTKIDTFGKVEALSPLSLSAAIVDLAETPYRPVSPDSRLALAMMGAGAVIGAAGLLVFTLGRMAKPRPRALQAPMTFSR